MASFAGANFLGLRSPFHPASWSVKPISSSAPTLVAFDFVERYVYFRDPDDYSENSYFTDDSLGWFAVFCHEGDWHLFSRKRTVLSRLSLR